jgi:hypothetical protein
MKTKHFSIIGSVCIATAIGIYTIWFFASSYDFSTYTKDNPLGIEANVIFDYNPYLMCPQLPCHASNTLQLNFTSKEGFELIAYNICDGIFCTKKESFENHIIYVHPKIVGINFGSDVKFSDGIHELLQVPLLESPCGTNFKTDLSNHTNPQAGLEAYNQKIRLLVSTENIPQQNIRILSNAIKVNNTNYTINYIITGDSNKLLNVTLGAKAKYLLLSLDAPSNGTLTVTIPRVLLDTKVDSQDENFTVLTDGKEITYAETKTDYQRTLSIAFDHRTEQIEIFAIAVG